MNAVASNDKLTAADELAKQLKIRVEAFLEML